jgi:hypothetical protein
LLSGGGVNEEERATCMPHMHACIHTWCIHTYDGGCMCACLCVHIHTDMHAYVSLLLGPLARYCACAVNDGD